MLGLPEKALVLIILSVISQGSAGPISSTFPLPFELPPSPEAAATSTSNGVKPASSSNSLTAPINPDAKPTMTDKFLPRPPTSTEPLWDSWNSWRNYDYDDYYNNYYYDRTTTTKRPVSSTSSNTMTTTLTTRSATTRTTTDGSTTTTKQATTTKSATTASRAVEFMTTSAPPKKIANTTSIDDLIQAYLQQSAVSPFLTDGITDSVNSNSTEPLSTMTTARPTLLTTLLRALSTPAAASPSITSFHPASSGDVLGPSQSEISYFPWMPEGRKTSTITGDNDDNLFPDDPLTSSEMNLPRIAIGLIDDTELAEGREREMRELSGAMMATLVVILVAGMLGIGIITGFYCIRAFCPGGLSHYGYRSLAESDPMQGF